MKKLIYILFLSVAVAYVLPLDAQVIEGEKPLSYYVDNAKRLSKANKESAAFSYLKKGITIYPDDPTLCYLLARYYEKKKDYSRARYYALHCIQNDPIHVDAKKVMLSVETASKHYSNAIAYCNELLEVVPYEKNYWRKKIDLYRKMGNEKMADQLLDRMLKIFPDDKQVQKDALYQKEVAYTNNMKNGSLAEATSQLEALINSNPKNKQYYEDLLNVYKRRGMFDQALSVADAALNQFGRSGSNFLKQKVSILCGQGKYQEALAFLSEGKKTYGSLASRLYDQVMKDASEVARLNDPYAMTAKQYGKDHNRDDLNYLLSTAVNKGYYDDAMYYLAEARKRGGLNKNLLAIEYDIELRAGHVSRANAILEQMYKENPNDTDVAETFGRMKLRAANEEFAQGDYRNAIPHLNEAIGMGFMDKDDLRSAHTKILSSYIELKDYDKAKEYYESLLSSASDEEQKSYASLYEEGMLKRIKGLADEENYLAVANEADNLLKVVPTSKDGLRYALNASDALKHEDAFNELAEKGYALYPDEPFFIVRKAISMQNNKEYSDAVDFVRDALSVNSTDKSLQNTFMEVCELRALEMIKANMADSALILLDEALGYNPKNRSLNYTKGLAYEKLKDMELAYKYQMKYTDVSLAELPEFRQHMRGLAYRGSTDYIDLSYTSISSNSQQESKAKTYVSSLATISYTHKDSLNSYTGEVDYKGVESDLEELYLDGKGGAGIQGLIQWDHDFGKGLTGYVNLSLANQFFNKVGFNVSLTKALERDWTISGRLGYRKTPDMLKYYYDDNDILTRITKSEFNLYIFTPGVSKTWQDRFLASGQVDCTLLNSSIYFNVNGKGKIFLNEDGVTALSIQAGVGTFPELTLFDSAAASHSFSDINTMVGLEGLWLATKNVALGLSGNWYTNYSPKMSNGVASISYRNLYSINLNLHVAL